MDRQSTFSWEELPARASPSPDCDRGSATPAAGSCLPFLRSLGVIGLNGLCGKTSPASYQVTEDGILAPSSGRWGSWGTGGPIACATLNGGEWPSEGAVCSLSDVLEISDVPPRYFLSAKACAGILRRAGRRGEKLPPALEHALQAVTTSGATTVQTFSYAMVEVVDGNRMQSPTASPDA